MEERIAEIEMKIAFQDETIAILNEVVIEQQNKLDQMEQMLKQLGEKANSEQSLFSGVEPEEPPPHY